MSVSVLFEKLVELKRKADEGDMSSQFQAGCMYANGEGAPMDYQSAFYYLSEAAKRGSRESCKVLCDLYEMLTKEVSDNLKQSFDGAAHPEIDCQTVKDAQMADEILAFLKEQFHKETPPRQVLELPIG